MPAAINEFFQLLIQPPGNLIYYLVLAFSVAAPLPFALYHWRITGYPQGRRVAAGLSTILLLLLGLFLLGGLTWQGLIPENNLLPPLDRGFALFSLILIVWLWTFPSSNRLADAATLLLSLLTITLVILNLAWWFGQDGITPYNGSLLDQAAQIYAILLSTFGMLLLLLRRPSGWSFGFSMLLLLFLGHLFQLVLPDFESSYAAPVRLAQIAAFPILITIPQRFLNISAVKLEDKKTPIPVVTQSPTTDIRLVQSLLALATQADFQAIYCELTRIIATVMLADFCLIISAPDEDPRIKIQCCYDLIRQDHRSGAQLDDKQVPLIAAALRHRRPLRLIDNKSNPDLSRLAQALNLKQTGHLLAVPVIEPEGKLLISLIILAPYTNRTWTNDDQSTLSDIASSVGQMIKSKNRDSEFRQQVTHRGSPIQTTQDVSQANFAQPKALRNFPGQEENNKPDPDTQAELRLALEEIARLRAIETENDTRTFTLNSTVRTFNRSHQLIQDLRQPMASITGYTDFLLGESVGIIGALQRKFLERIRTAAERINALLDDSLQVDQLGMNTMHLNQRVINLSDVIDEAMLKSTPELRKKNIAIRVNMPDKLPEVFADAQTLEQVITSLIENAGKVSPVGGTISLRVEVKMEGKEKGFVVLQIASQGREISSHDLSHVFSQPQSAPVDGVGDSVTGLSNIKTLIEALGGRMWVDNQESIGSVFSILLPVSNLKQQAEI
jgi:signal transduction histidine kinase